MTRYSVCVGGRWVTALYDSGTGIGLTDQRQDASSWATHAAAVDAAKVVSQFFSEPAWIHVAEEPDYPASWNVSDGAAA